MSKTSKKKVVEEKPPFAPVREPLEKPKITPEEEIEELKMSYRDNGHVYFPVQNKEKIELIFRMFDDGEKGYVTFDELKVADAYLSNVYESQELLLNLYNLMTKKTTGESMAGIGLDDLMLILTKRFKDNDKKKDITDAFKFLVKENPPAGEDEPQDMIKSDKFFDHLIYNGYKYTDEMAEAVLKEGDPKNKGQFGYTKFTDHILKTDKKKGKGKKKK